MGWYNPLSWAVFDVAGTAWAREVGAAHDQAVTWIERTASSKGWPGEWTKRARDLADEARGTNREPIGYWSSLAALWRDARQPPDGWVELGATWTSASGAATTQKASDDTASVAGVAGGTLAASAGDVADVSQWIRDHRKGLAVMVVVVLVVLAVVYVSAVAKK